METGKRSRIVRTLIILAASLYLSACGYRGPLYIPGQPGDPALDKQNRGARPTVPPSLPTPT
ncbi:MAG TPA: lipoprotein, partial [Burkholderiaceae bacterium]|nr:lipoprotein [Burkholderiaceae bacterium]